MQLTLEQKEKVLAACRQAVDRRFKEAEEVIASVQEAAANETKSSAGDKYETGREMLRQERDKAELALAEAEKLKHAVKNIDIAERASIHPGALVQTDRGLFFIGIALGKLQVDNVPVFTISIYSPIGKLMKEKKAGDTLALRGVQYTIQQVI